MLGKTNLGLDDGLANVGHGFAISRNIHAHVTTNVVQGDRDQEIVNVVATQMCVTVGRDDLKYSVMQFEDRYVERAAAQVVNGDNAVLFLVEPVGQGSGCRLIYESEDFE